jgi:hypothetical protein
MVIKFNKFERIGNSSITKQNLEEKVENKRV